MALRAASPSAFVMLFLMLPFLPAGVLATALYSLPSSHQWLLGWHRWATPPAWSLPLLFNPFLAGEGPTNLTLTGLLYCWPCTSHEGWPQHSPISIVLSTADCWDDTADTRAGWEREGSTAGCPSPLAGCQYCLWMGYDEGRYKDISAPAISQRSKLVALT